MCFVMAILIPILGIQFSEPAHAADLSQFQPGNIISDSVFFNGSGYSAVQIQAFLESKVPTCTINNGQASHAAGAPYGSTSISNFCLRNYVQDTPTMAAQPGLCAQYVGGTAESAATIISKVGIACGINPKVLLVLLEKEQSLVTDTWPTVRQFTSATGFACYDNGQPCVSDYDGFFYQVWSAARQFQRYGTAPFTWYPVGQTTNILYQANMPECGSLPVNIQNRATAALYYYTPYTPNQAALAAGYGRGDSCSAYGNRNFYQLFVDWFGSTQGFEVGTYYIDFAFNNSSWLGYASGPMVCDGPDGGCSQAFQNAIVTSSSHSYAAGLLNKYLPTWSNYGRQWGILGYPVRSETPSHWGDIVRQEFQGGWIVNNGSGFRTVLNIELATWANWGRQTGALGMPVTDRFCDAKICSQRFDGGFIIFDETSSPRVMPTAVYDTWSNWGRNMGILGFPTSDPSVPGGTNFVQTFQGGTITVTNGVGVVTATTDPWFNTIINSNWLGSASTSRLCTLGAGGCYQDYTNGWVVKNGTSVFAVPNAVKNAWFNWGREYGILGYPTSAPSAAPSTGNYTQTFQGGTITVTNGVGVVTPG